MEIISIEKRPLRSLYRALGSSLSEWIALTASVVVSV